MATAKKIITIGNMKGGVGKSNITALMATHLNQNKKNNVVVFDGDDMQRTISVKRQDNIDEGMNSDNAFKIVEADSIQIPDLIETFYDDMDYMFIDLPGNLKQKGVINSLAYTDIFIIPTSLTDDDIDSTVRFIDLIKKEIIPLRKKNNLETKIYGILSKVNVTSKEYTDYLQNLENLPVEFLKVPFPYSVVLQRQINTVKTIEYKSKTFDLQDLYQEFNNILKG